MRARTFIIAAVCLAVLLHSASAAAQLRATPFVSGLTFPVGFVQDPSDPATQYVIEQGGRIRVIRNGALQGAPFLDLSASISAGGERGLLGLAFPPDYATSGRFYVNFTNTAGDTVVARFTRLAANPLLADPSTRFDLRWSTGERVIRQPFSNHNGGNLVFGPDGFLYVGMGDGGSGNDPSHFAQNLSSLLGKMLRIDVSVPDSDPAGFRIPADNPFAGSGTPEIWHVGLRNPWRWSFDDPARGGTGALVIGDVGQNTWEEVDYAPAGRGGLNFGWRNREGAHDNVTSLPPAFQPLIDPIFEYQHPTGVSITGGFVYRGTALPASFRGRYFFADLNGRVWSIRLTVNQTTGFATASDLIEHTAELGTPGAITSFGVDAAGELYFTDYGGGTILRIESTAPPAGPNAIVHIDVPANGALVSQPFLIAGWALDTGSASSPGIDAIHVWAFPNSGAAPQFVGATTVGAPRPDVAAAFGSQFGTAGYGLFARGLAPGGYRVLVFGLVRATGNFTVVAFVDVTVARTSIVSIDGPGNNATVDRPFIVGGWAIDRAAPSGTGIDTIHVWGIPVAPAGAPVFLGPASFGDRPDVAAIFGAQFQRSGYGVIANPPAPGVWDILVFPHSTVTGVFEPAGVLRVTVR
jgi:glucose/arabinose dehydrogenase